MSANITLRLDERTIKRIRHLAVDRETSVSAWVAELIQRALTELDGFEPARARAMQALERPVPVDDGPLSRDQTHER
jgi:hypothetical protein